jgi:hypothetical protein
VRILIVGDIVGSPGRTAFARVVGQMRSRQEVDCVIANAENAAGGRGLTPSLAEELFNAGADVLTLGDHAWDQKEMVLHIDKDPRILRPANYPPGSPGKGWVTIQSAAGPVTVIALIGRVFMPPTNDCPFRTVDSILTPAGGLAKVIVVDVHAEATSEKIGLGRYLDGRVSAVVGTHTHVQTSDETILPKGTAYLTDLGMTGPKDSILGRDAESVLHKFVTGVPTPFRVADKDVMLEGALVTVDEKTGKATKIKRIREKIES